MHFRKKLLEHVLSYVILSSAIVPCSITSCADYTRTQSISKATVAPQNKQATGICIETLTETSTSMAVTSSETTTSSSTTTSKTSTTTTATTTLLEESTTTCVADQPYEELEENIEDPEPIEYNFEDIWNGIIIQDHVIETALCPAYQVNVDAYDVVQDVGYLSKEHDIRVFGHNTRSFSILESVCVDDTIILVNDGIPSYYEVRRSELGKANPEHTDIFSCDYGDSIYKGDFGFENTLRLITCSSSYDSSYRWVIIAEKVY